MVVFPSSLFAFVLCLRASSAGVDSWNAEIPNSVVGLSGSCVVIPCKFNYPSDRKSYYQFTGIWYTDKYDIIYHKETNKIISKFRGRTTLLGDLHQKDCTLKINSLHHSDGGTYMFRIEIKDLDKATFLKNKVSISVKDLPEQPTISVKEEVMSQRKATATCIVSHSCSSDPPRLTWSHEGTLTSLSHPQDHGQWRLTSSLTFTPSREDHNKPLICSADFSGGNKVTSSKTLKVKYPPYNVNMMSYSPVKENTSVKLICSCDSNPPASFQWISLNGSLLANGPTYKLNQVSRYTEAISCTANNTEGQNNSGPQKINVLYPPYNVNVKSNSPVKENTSVELICTCDSNPPAKFQWISLNGSLLANGPTYKLNHVSRYTEAISCTASNTEGRNSSGPQKINVLYPPEIKNESSCKSGPLTVCVCIVDSNPPSEVKWLGLSTTFPSSSIEQNGFLSTFTLQGWLGFPDAINCSASNSEGNSVITMQVPHRGMIIYIVVATAAVLVTLVVISVCVAKRHRKEEKINDIYTYNKDDSNDYENWECDDKDLPRGQHEDEAVYANTSK
ncbi:myelin-associated glycoprotein-like [Paramisgurnus dabryanus]|uniref:myelin-associated glycoprotein-like n=1 Tax=Paramisgurnus dabryanus TaxID=90735 RepID=UPI0031F39390